MAIFTWPHCFKESAQLNPSQGFHDISVLIDPKQWSIKHNYIEIL